ncbi:Zn(2)-C6 fungal-type transcriptional factor [Mycena kentingensis (nom. inval.)]|nr:Zn(2)-C6 fungal-type transcriptional factor [Mycena kentingensis (nom. inval.)]
MLVRPKKAPACDSCKSKRVLCHPQPNGPCPRCTEKGILCKTTPIPRGRPRKTQSPGPPVLLSSPAPSSSNTAELSRCALLTPELVKHLFMCFHERREYRNPIFQYFNIEKTLVAASWHHHLLPIQEAVLTAAICAAAATLSWHPAVLGPGVCPDSLADESVFFSGADLRAFGERRAPVCRILKDYAIRVAFEARIMLEPTEWNVASCFLLDTLEHDISASSRPWASVYMSHLRAVALNWPNEPKKSRALWSGWMMVESVLAAVNQKPVLVTPADQLLLSGPPPQSLEELLESLEEETAQPLSFNFTNTRAALVFTVVFPFLFHSITIARDFHQHISGTYAHRHPLSEPVILKLLTTLATMQSIINHCVGDVDFPDASQIPKDKTPTELRADASTFPELRSCAFVMSLIFVAFALSLYRELESHAEPGPGSDVPAGLQVDFATNMKSRWARTRMASFRQQAHDMARSALPDLKRMLILQSGPFRHGAIRLEWSAIIEWGEFLADEADASSEGILPADVAVYESLLNSLKGTAYSCVPPTLNSVIKRLETHLATYHLKASTEMGMNMDDLETGNLVSEMSFLLDGSFFAVPDATFGI